MNEVNHWRRVVLWWVGASVIATPLVVFVAAPGLPPGNGTVESFEECDHGTANGASGNSCSATCRCVGAFPCP